MGSVRHGSDVSSIQFRQAIEQAPVAILLLKGEDLVIEMANPAVLVLMDRGSA
ncbi:hypothetical protein [Spirosoma sp.]|uniref:PAS domain-containing protein n=1 Tax=Spirosoma sp. TaxID=1899569 RepID=UPI00262FC217|nr:hypothetical protein [Spirosoma sp.]MCX6215266.1 hypothetical protein [Spirosoma sp.]